MIGAKGKTSFDAQKVVKAIDAGQPGALAKAGSFIWRRARSMLRPRKAYSRAGQPPSLRSAQSPLKKLTVFAVDKRTRSVVIGPTSFGARAAPVIEAGGNEQINLFGKKIVSARYDPRPWMGPALQEELAAGTIPPAWEGSVRA